MLTHWPSIDHELGEIGPLCGSDDSRLTTDAEDPELCGACRMLRGDEPPDVETLELPEEAVGTLAPQTVEAASDPTPEVVYEPDQVPDGDALPKSSDDPEEPTRLKSPKPYRVKRRDRSCPACGDTYRVGEVRRDAQGRAIAEDTSSQPRNCCGKPECVAEVRRRTQAALADAESDDG